MIEIELPHVDDVPDVKMVRLQPGDVVVCRVGHHLTDEEFDDLRERLREGFSGYKIAVLEGGMSIEVLRAEVPREE